MAETRVILPESDLKMLAEHIASNLAISNDRPIEAEEVKNLLGKPNKHATLIWMKRNLPNLKSTRLGDLVFFSRKELNEALLSKASL